MEFIKWIPTRVKELQNKSPEEIAMTLNKLSKTPEGQKQLETLIQEFKSENAAIQPEETGMFKKGGKKTINTPKGLIHSDGEGGYKDIDGRDAGYKEGYFKERAAQRASDRLAEQEFRSDSTYHALPGGPIYTRSTFYPFSTDTLVSKNGKFYSNSLGRSIRKFVTGTSPFDQINRAIDSIAGYSTPRYNNGGEVQEKKHLKWEELRKATIIDKFKKVK